MPKVDWITWKTNPEEIINPDIIENNIHDVFQNYNTYMNPVVYEQIKHEVNTGILGKDKMIFMSDTPINEIALEILSKIDEIKSTVDNLVTNVKKSTTEQKQIEKQQLINEIEIKIKNEEETLNSVKMNDNMKNKIIDMGGNPNDVVYIIEDRINKLKERLEAARAL